VVTTAVALLTAFLIIVATGCTLAAVYDWIERRTE
jgi:hypothetical protein